MWSILICPIISYTNITQSLATAVLIHSSVWALFHWKVMYFIKLKYHIGLNIKQPSLFPTAVFGKRLFEDKKPFQTRPVESVSKDTISLKRRQFSWSFFSLFHLSGFWSGKNDFLQLLAFFKRSLSSSSWHCMTAVTWLPDTGFHIRSVSAAKTSFHLLEIHFLWNTFHNQTGRNSLVYQH